MLQPDLWNSSENELVKKSTSPQGERISIRIFFFCRNPISIITVMPFLLTAYRMDPVIAAIRRELRENADPVIRESSKRFFKEEIRCYGIKTATVTAIAKEYWKQVKSRDKNKIFSLCEELYRSGCMEESFIVSTWAHSLSDRFEEGDLAVFERWIDTWITNWASCDGFCNHAMGDFFSKYPDRFRT